METMRRPARPTAPRAHRHGGRAGVADRPEGAVTRLLAWALAAAIGQALLMGSGALSDWPLHTLVWFTF